MSHTPLSFPAGVPVPEGVPGADAGAGPGAAGECPRAAPPPLPGGCGPPRLHCAPHAAAPAAMKTPPPWGRPPQAPPGPPPAPPQRHPQTRAGLGCSWGALAPQPVLLSWGPHSRDFGGGAAVILEIWGCRGSSWSPLPLGPILGHFPFFCFFIPLSSTPPLGHRGMAPLHLHEGGSPKLQPPPPPTTPHY